jgi:hypothetical protein
MALVVEHFLDFISRHYLFYIVYVRYTKWWVHENNYCDVCTGCECLNVLDSAATSGFVILCML